MPAMALANSAPSPAGIGIRGLCRFTAILLLSLPTGLHAQSLGTPTASPLILKPATQDTAPVTIRPILQELTGRPHTVRWWEAAAVVWGTLGVTAADEKVTHEFREHPTHSAENIASVFRRVGQPEVYAVLPLGLLTTGFLTRDPEITRAGGRLAASVVASTVAFNTLKLLSGRARPDAGAGAFAFRPFSGQGGFPSGHSSVAFALATSLADDLHNAWAAAGLYAVAAGTAWSRVYDERHWASDVIFGAALGITTAKVVSGRWRIFGLRPPHFLIEADAARLAVRIPVQ
jgi:membrane-associated phospholipid phosphatase